MRQADTIAAKVDELLRLADAVKDAAVVATLTRLPTDYTKWDVATTALAQAREEFERWLRRPAMRGEAP